MESNEKKGLIYSLNTFTMIDKKTGKENGMINIHYIYEKDESATNLGWQSGQAYFVFNDDLFKYLKANLLKNCSLHFNFVQDYNDNTRFTLKLFKINEYVIKQ